jgi:hypothetical protein
VIIQAVLAMVNRTDTPLIEFLSEEEARERGGQGYLRNGAETADYHIRAAQEGVRLQVLGRPLVQSQTSCAQCRRLSVDFA